MILETDNIGGKNLKREKEMDMNITYKRNMNHTYTLFSGGSVQTENYEVQVALHRLLKGLLPCSLHALDGNQIWYCENTSLQKLSSYCQMHPLGKKELTWRCRNIL